MEWADIVKRDTAWNEARKDLIENNKKVDNNRLHRCLKYGSLTELDAECIAELLVEYPQT